MNVLLKLFFPLSKKIIFFSPILANNNLPLKIYCENIVIAFLNFNFLFFILYFPYFFFFSSIFPSFFPHFFSPSHTYSYSFLFFLLSSFFPTTSSEFQNIPQSSLSFSFFFYFLSFFLSLFSLTTWFASFVPSIPSKHTNLKVTHNHTIWFSSNEDRERVKSPKEENCLHRLLICSAFTTACLPPDRYLISSPLPTTCSRNGSDRFFSFFGFDFIIGFLCKIVL